MTTESCRILVTAGVEVFRDLHAPADGWCLEQQARDPRRMRYALIGVAAWVLLALPIAPAVAQVRYPIVADRDMTTTAGVVTLLTLQHLIAAGENRLLPPQLFEEDASARRLLGAAYRLGRLIALDLPVDHFLIAVNHEVFGHGARLRELGATRIRYRFDLPFPYGGGGASTAFSLSDVRPLTTAETLAIYISGIEAHNVSGQVIELRALGRGRLHYREAMLYFFTQFSALGYVFEAMDTTDPSSHDVNEFLRTLNAACATANCEPLASRRLHRRALIGLANPLLAYSVYGLFASHLWHGEDWVDVPSLKLGRGLSYLPWFRFQLGPYGTEWVWEQGIVGHGRLLNLSVRMAHPGMAPAWGTGVGIRPLATRRQWSLNVSGHVWSQPRSGPSADRDDSRMGGAASATIVVRFRETPLLARPAGFFMEGGYKTRGFMPGEFLGAGAIVRIGMSFESR